MGPIRWERDPGLSRPLLVMAFEGWNDAGDAASMALSYLARAWEAERFATVESEDFYDFTVTRPQVRLAEDGGRRIDWPDVEILGARVPGSRHDLVLVRGVEPQLRWRAFTGAVVELAGRLETELAVTLGALLADVPHTRPVRVSGTTDNTELAGRLGLEAPAYEGPTGIVGVLHEALYRSGIPAASLWAAVPHYIQQLPSPAAALALVERSAALLGAPVDAPDLRAAAAEYLREVDERVAQDDDAAAYVAHLEDADDGQHREPGPKERLQLGSADELAAEVEAFLREHRER